MTTSVQWRDLTLGGPSSPYRVTGLDGWEELPPARVDRTSRARSHGSHPSPVWADERTVTVAGFCGSSDEREALLRALRAGLGGFAETGEPLAVTDLGRTLTARAQIVRASATRQAGSWGSGRFGWAAQWRCPDPLRYGPLRTATTGLPGGGGGLTYPLYATTGRLDYGQPGDAGRITLTNPGDADAPVLLTVVGPHAAGFEVSAGGRRITYPTPVPAGQTITVDTATGRVLAEGTADRRGELRHADFFQIPAHGSVTAQYTSLGGGSDPDATLTATWSEAHW